MLRVMNSDSPATIKAAKKLAIVWLNEQRAKAQLMPIKTVTALWWRANGEHFLNQVRHLNTLAVS